MNVQRSSVGTTETARRHSARPTYGFARAAASQPFLCYTTRGPFFQVVFLMTGRGQVRLGAWAGCHSHQHLDVSVNIGRIPKYPLG